MPHIKDPMGFPIPHEDVDAITINALEEANKAVGIGDVDAANLIAAANLNPSTTAGVSNTDMSTINAGVLNTLPAYQQALAIADQVYQEREPISPAMLSFLFFSKMAEESSKPGSTALGAAGAAAATPAAYLMKERELDAADKKAKATMAATLTTSLSKAPSSPKKYTIQNLPAVNKALGTNLPAGTTEISLTPTDFAKVPVGSVVGFTKPDKADKPTMPKSFVVTAEGGIEVDGKNIPKGQTTLLTTDEALVNRANIEEAKTGPSDFEAEKFLSGQYDKAFPVKTYRDLDQQFQKVQVSYEQAYKIGRPQVADVSMIFAYMKMLDPRSVVREGEQAQAQGTGGALDLAINTYNKLLGGGSLTDAQRKSFRDAAYALITPAVADLEAYNTQFQGRLSDTNVKFEGFKVKPKVYDLSFFMTKPPTDQLKNKTSEELLLLLEADNLKDDQDFIDAVNDIVDSRIS